MSLFNEKNDLKLRIQISVIFTVIFAGGWCLSQQTGNLFWLCLSQNTYLNHLAIWLSLGVLIFILLTSIGKKSSRKEGKVTIFLFIFCFLNILDYGMRSIFGPIAEWPIPVLFGWSLITFFYPAVAILLAFKVSVSRYLVKMAIQICIVPTLLFTYYAIPSEFAIIEVEKPIRKGNRTPVHLILFDMLSYDFIFKNQKIEPVYNHLEAFSNEADIYINAFSPAGTTGEAVVGLTTGLDFEYTGHNLNRWTVCTKDSVERKEIASYETLFSMANKSGYNVFLRAFALPYLNNFGEHVQSGKVHPFDTLWRVGMHSLIWPVLSPGGIQHQKTTVEMLNDYESRIRKNPHNTFFYTHWNIPHDPFIYDAKGQMLNRIELTKNLIKKPGRKLNYQRQLIGTDRIFGQLMEALKNSGTYDQSLIIVTSDHNIEGYGFNMKHIPLIIKRPHQKKFTILKSEVTTYNLIKFIKYFIEEGKCKNTILEYSDGQLS
jgi:hypothetical protein